MQFYKIEENMFTEILPGWQLLCIMQHIIYRV